MQNFRLWTPVANAFDAYRRRVVAEPDSIYEHTWRLIHIHESLVVTLGIALATRLLSLWKDQESLQDDANRLRRKVTGLSTPGDPSDEGLSSGDACLDGYIKPWIDLLKSYGSAVADGSSEYCAAIRSYISEKPEQPLAFIEAWKKIAEVPQVFLGSLSRADRYDAINTLRNKLAHVPVPHKILQDLHWGLRQEVFGLMSPEYKSKSDSPDDDFEAKKWHKPLHGQLVAGKFFVTGSAVFGQHELQGIIQDRALVSMSVRGDSEEHWPVAPFVRVDAELKVSLLFLLSDFRTDPSSDVFKGEYHRFAAEMLPVQKESVRQALVADWIPSSSIPAKMLDSIATEVPVLDVGGAHPTHSEFDIVETQSSYSLRRIGDEAFRVREFPRAVQAFEALSLANDPVNYNDVAKSKHGGALWRVAEGYGADTEKKTLALEKAITLLDQASLHRDPSYKARAYYEKSKALWHLWRLNGLRDSLERSLESAERAASLQNEVSFISWFEKVRDDLGSQGFNHSDDE